MSATPFEMVRASGGPPSRRLCPQKRGYTLVTDGTENHLVLWDLRPQGVTGSKMELVCDLCHITLNKNAVYGDASAMTPGGVRIGTPAMTSRGLKEADWETIAEFLDRCVKLCLKVQESHGKMLKDFKTGLDQSEELKKLKEDVMTWSSKFPMPGFAVPK